MANETFRHAKAFDYYYSLGEKRSYDLVAEKMGVSRTSVANWAKWYNWQVRVKERDNKLSTSMFKATDDDIVATVTRYRKIINASVANYIQKLKDGKIPVKSSADFIKLVELDLKLAGILDDKSENNENGKTVITFSINDPDK